MKPPNSLVAEAPVPPLATGIAEPEVVVPRRVTAHVDEETKRSQDDTTRLVAQAATAGSAEGQAKDLTCNEAEVDALSSGEQHHTWNIPIPRIRYNYGTRLPPTPAYGTCIPMFLFDAITLQAHVRSSLRA